MHLIIRCKLKLSRQLCFHYPLYCLFLSKFRIPTCSFFKAIIKSMDEATLNYLFRFGILYFYIQKCNGNIFASLNPLSSIFLHAVLNKKQFFKKCITKSIYTTFIYFKFARHFFGTLN